VTFYSENNGQLGASTTAANASYIQVTIGDDSRSPWKVVPTFLAAVGATPNPTEATAIARVTYASCAEIHGFICGSGLTSTTPGTQYLFFTKAGGGNGNWGVIQPGDLALFTQVTLPACTSNIIIQQTGNGSHRPLVDGMNTRFDHPAGNTSDEQTTAPIPIDGMSPTGHGNSCNNPGPAVPTGFDPTEYASTCVGTGSCPLPRDPNIADWGNDGGNGASVGNGISDPNLLPALNAYWKNQHGTNWPTVGGVPITRYQAYQLEVSGAAPFTNAAEPNAPMCSVNNTTNDYTRRIIHMAIADTVCPNGQSVNPPYTRYADFFLTEDAFLSAVGEPYYGRRGNGGQPVIYAELVAIHNANENGSLLHKIVQLVK